MDILKIIAKNLNDWMEAETRLNTSQKLANASKVGFGTIQRARNADANLTIKNIEALAKAFRRSPTDLISPSSVAYLDPQTTLLIAKETRPDEELLLAQYNALSEAHQEKLLAYIEGLTAAKSAKTTPRTQRASIKAFHMPPLVDTRQPKPAKKRKAG